jgi:hypothetical protein
VSYQSLSDFAIQLENEYLDDDGAEMWEGSPFAWIRDNKPATIGAIGRRLARSVFQEAGIQSEFSRYTLIAGNATIAIKFSMEWTGGGFIFEQIKDNNYDYILCLGIRPDAAHGWLIPKHEVIENGTWQTRDGLRSQHTGSTGQETAWLNVNPDNPPEWMSPYGGEISEAELRIAQFLAVEEN